MSSSLKPITIKRVWEFFLLKVIRTSWHKAHYLRLNIDIERIDSLLSGFDLPVKRLVYEDFLMGDPDVFTQSKLDVYKSRCKDPNYQAYGIVENGRLVYSTWISLRRLGMSVETKPVFLLPNEGYLEDSYCSPVARGKGLHSKMNIFRIRKLYEAGKDRVIVIVQEGNIPAYRVQLKSGFEDIGCFFHGYILGIKFNTLNKAKFDSK